MKMRVRKWGNSLALRIPKSLAEEAGLREKSLIDISFNDGRIILRPLYTYDLDELLKQVTEENKHGEINL